LGSYIKEIAIVSLAAVCVMALYKGIDSALVGAVAAIIGGIAGYEIRKRKQ